MSSHYAYSQSKTNHHYYKRYGNTSGSIALEDLETISETFKRLPGVSQTLRELPLCIEKLGQITNFSIQRHAGIDEILESLRADSKQFSEILRLSAHEADHEYQFSIEMIELCDILMRGGASGEHTEELLQTMKARASHMRACSSQVAQEFRKVNVRLVQTGKNIPIAVGQLVVRKQYVVDRKRAAERVARPLQFLKGGLTTAGGVVGIIAGISAIAFPPVALLALSVVFPILSILVNVIEGSNRRRIRERRAEEQELKAAIKRLRNISSTLNSVIDNIDAFTGFWQNIELLLADIGDRLAELEYLRLSPSGKIRIEMMRNLWAEANEEYRRYRIDLGRLRSIHSRLEASRFSGSGRSYTAPMG